MADKTVSKLCSYPIKGFSPHFLEKADLNIGGTFPFDRLYALKRGDWHFDKNQPEYHHKTKFYMLLRDEKLAELKTRFSFENFSVEITTPDAQKQVFYLENQAGLKYLERFLIGFLSPSEALNIVTAKSHSMSDVPMQVASLINLASVQDLAEKIGQKIDPIRFRGNVYFSGNNPWEEFNWVDKHLKIGTTEFRVVKPIERCKATHVDPNTGIRDLPVVPALLKNYGHFKMGIYARVTQAGTILLGDEIIVL